MQKWQHGMQYWALQGALLVMLVLVIAWVPRAQAAKPIRIGFGMALTGGLAANGKAALLAMQIWAEDVNNRGGLLGGEVELIYYDDQAKPANIPAIYTKLLDIDKVDFVVSGYGTNLIAPAKMFQRCWSAMLSGCTRVRATFAQIE